jgi:hypothetical protein
MQKNIFFSLFLGFFASFCFAQSTYTACYYLNTSMANEFYKNGDLKNALIYFEKGRAFAQAYHRSDVVAVAACYAEKGDNAAAFALLKTALDKGRRFDWFENVYYFDKLKTLPEWQNLQTYTPKIRMTQKARAYRDLIHGLTHEMEDVFAEMEKNPAAAARLPVLDSAAAVVLVEIIDRLGVPTEGELDDEDVQEFLGMFIKVGMYDKKTYDFLRAQTPAFLRNGVFRAKEYSAVLDNWNSQWGQTGLEGDVILPVFGNDQTAIGGFTREQLAQINDNRTSIGLLPYGMDISPESQTKINAIVDKNCKPKK